ncbi:MAG: hypothetical protein Q9204_006131, partial [Flavoplaca sp. TL-2023a]
SVHVVVNIPEELEVVALVNPVTGGELTADNVPDEDSNDEVVPGVVPGPETLVVKDMVHAVPRFRHASTHRKSVQVAVVTRLVVAGFDVAKVVLGDNIDPNDEVVVDRSPDTVGVGRVEVAVEDICDGKTEVDSSDDIRAELDVEILIGEEDAVGMNDEEVWAAKPEVLDKVEDVNVELLWFGFGTHVGPRHRLRQSKPEQEGVGDSGLIVELDYVMVGDVLETVDDAIGDIAVDPKFNVLVSRLLVVLAETDGVDVKMLVGVAVEQPGPRQRDTHSVPLQDVVNDEDRLVILVDAGAEEMPATEALDVAEVAVEGTEEGDELRLCSVDGTTFEEGVGEPDEGEFAELEETVEVVGAPEIFVLDVAGVVWPEASELGEDAVLLWLEEDNPLEELDMGVGDESVETMPVDVDAIWFDISELGEFGRDEVGEVAEIGLGEDDEIDAVPPFALVDVADICDPEVVEDDEFNEVLKIEELSRDVGG